MSFVTIQPGEAGWRSVWRLGPMREGAVGLT